MNQGQQPPPAPQAQQEAPPAPQAQPAIAAAPPVLPAPPPPVVPAPPAPAAFALGPGRSHAVSWTTTTPIQGPQQRNCITRP